MNELIVRWKNGEVAIYRFTTKGDAVAAKMICENHCGNEIRDIKIIASEQTRWIPVSERLPEEFICDDGYVEPSDYVLVWGDHGNYGVSRYWGNRKSKIENPNSYKDWMDLDWVEQKPRAWMLLPEPYKEDAE